MMGNPWREVFCRARQRFFEMVFQYRKEQRIGRALIK